MTKIFIKPDKAEYINELLKKQGFQKEYRVLCASEIKQDVDYINTHKNEFTVFQGKDENYTLTSDAYLDRFYLRDDVNAIYFDCYFDRTPIEDMKLLAAFFQLKANCISHIEGSDIWLERGELTDAQKKLIISKTKEKPGPELLPEEEQRTPDIQGGNLLCKSWGLEPFWVIMGSVDRPTFLKEKKYKDDLYNSVYRDNNGYSFMMLPLLKLGYQGDQRWEIFESAWGLGLREHHAFFLPFIYNVHYNTKKTQDEYATEMAEFYTTDELLERLGKVMTSASDRTDFSLVGGAVKGNNLDKSFGRDCALKQSLYMLSKAIRIKSGMPIQRLCIDDSGIYLLNKKQRMDLVSKFLSGNIRITIN